MGSLQEGACSPPGDCPFIFMRRMPQSEKTPKGFSSVALRGRRPREGALGRPQSQEIPLGGEREPFGAEEKAIPHKGGIPQNIKAGGEP